MTKKRKRAKKAKVRRAEAVTVIEHFTSVRHFCLPTRMILKMKRERDMNLHNNVRSSCSLLILSLMLYFSAEDFSHTVSIFKHTFEIGKQCRLSIKSTQKTVEDNMHIGRVKEIFL